MVLDNGAIVEFDSPANLLKQNSVFTKMAQDASLGMSHAALKAQVSWPPAGGQPDVLRDFLQLHEKITENRFVLVTQLQKMMTAVTLPKPFVVQLR